MTNRFEAPLAFAEQTVLPEWIDFNGHMNVAFYLLAFDRCVDDMYNRLGIGPAQIEETNHSVFTLEAHIVYLREVSEGDPLAVTGRLLDYDARRVHAYFEMHHAGEGYPAAAMEQIGIHVDLATRKPAAFARPGVALLQDMFQVHQALPEAEHAGRVIGIRRK